MLVASLDDDACEVLSAVNCLSPVHCGSREGWTLDPDRTGKRPGVGVGGQLGNIPGSVTAKLSPEGRARACQRMWEWKAEPRPRAA